MQFFDAPFRAEESPEAASAIKDLRDLSHFTKRVPQPYSQQGTSSASDGGPDLLTDLREEITSLNSPRIRFIVGPAGAGKSVLFQGLFAIFIVISSNSKISLSRHADPSHSFRNTSVRQGQFAQSRS